MRIQIVATSDLNFDQRVLRVASALRDAGYEVSVTGRRLFNKKPPDWHGIQTELLGLPVKKGPLFYALFNTRLFFRLLASGDDVIWAVDLDTLPGAWCAGFFSRKKVVLDAHEHFVETPELVRRPWVQAIWRTMARLFIPRVDLAITVNALLADEMSRVYRFPFHAVRNMPFPRERLHVRREPLLWYQGALNEGRGLEQLIESLVHLPGYRVGLAGNGDIAESLKVLAERLGVADRVQFHGMMTTEHLHERASAAFLGYNVLKKKGKSYYLSLSNKFFDYVQAGLPSVNSPFPVYKAYLQQHSVGLYFEGANAAHLANLVRQLEKDSARYSDMVEACLQAARIWHWNHESKLLIDLVRDELDR
jgi:glycosyltransferase involved in cell wall biosynthesis